MEIIKNPEFETRKMKIDLHVHTRERSQCGSSAAEEQICAAIDAELDAIVFTDHDRLAPLHFLQVMNEKYAPFRVFGGIEVSIEVDWSYEHLLVLGVHDDVLERKRWSYPELYNFVLEQDGFLALAHPFRFHQFIELDLECFPPDAIEVYSQNTPRSEERRILNLVEELGVRILSNSDAHHTRSLGRYYNVLERVPADEQELIEILKSGLFTCVRPE